MKDTFRANDEKITMRLQAAALGAAANGIIITDPKGFILWANPAFTRLSGYSSDEVIGKSTKLLKSGKQDPAYYKDLWETITSGKVWHGELINRRKDGSHYIEEMTITPVLNENNEATHFISIKQDITARKIAEEKLKQTLTKLEMQYHEVEKTRGEVRAILDATSEAIILISREDKFLWVNRCFERFFSIKAKQLLGHSFAELLPQFERIFQNPSAIKARFEEATRNKNSEYKETVLQMWPQKRELEIYSVPVQEKVDREHLGQLYVFRDVTYEREVERMKSEFVSLVSHELRTPLTSISGYADMLLDGDAGKLQQEQADFLHIIKRNAGLLDMLVKDLLDVSRIESGAIKLNLAPVDISSLISEVARSLRPQIESKNQTLSIILPKELPSVEGDANRIAQVLTNFVSNAHKYTQPGGIISIIAHVEKGQLRIDIKDTGIGISEEDQKRLFSRFFRSENPEVQKVGGTGLGLWIARSLIEMQGGEVMVSSQPGMGSTFSFSLPLD